MADNGEFRRLSREALDELAGEKLSERAAQSLIDAKVSAPASLTEALDVLMDEAAVESGTPE